MKLSKKLQKEIALTSIFNDVLIERFTTSDGCFTDHAPEMWDDAEKEIFDLTSEVEDRLKEKILVLLGVTNDTKRC